MEWVAVLFPLSGVIVYLAVTRVGFGRMRCSYCWRRRMVMLDGKYKGCHKHLGKANIDSNRAFHGHDSITDEATRYE